MARMAGNVSWQRLSGVRYPLSSALTCRRTGRCGGGVTDFTEYGLPADLERDLWAWQEHFDANFHRETDLGLTTA